MTATYKAKSLLYTFRKRGNGLSECKGSVLFADRSTRAVTVLSQSPSAGFHAINHILFKAK
jgi:hypothetical protein